MVRRKRTKSKARRTSFKLGTSKRKKERKTAYGPILMRILKVLAVACAVAGVGIGLILLDKYVRKTVPVSKRTATLKLVDVPGWVNAALREKIYAAAKGDGEELRLDEDAARSVQLNVEKRVAWLDDVQVQVTHDGLHIGGRWRKPIALVKLGLQRYYVDADMVVLDFVQISNLPIVNVKGLALPTKLPLRGEVWQRDDLAAAVAVLKLLDRRDKNDRSQKPLLYEIESIDVSNFNGRQDSRSSHIILYAKDDTEIMWGAEIGAWKRYLEATDEQKLAKLYGYYKKYGSLQNRVKYINLSEPQGSVPLPIDKY